MWFDILQSGQYYTDEWIWTEWGVLVLCQLDRMHLGICNAYHDALEVGFCRIREEDHEETGSR